MEAKLPRRIAIVGLGLMGGSLALAVRHSLPSVEVVGVDSPSVLAAAGDAIHIGYPPEELDRAVARAGIVFLATPIRVISQLIEEVAPKLQTGTILTDLGSTKAEICNLAQESVPEGVYFIGGHPLTGAEKNGLSNADPFLFQSAIYVLTPLPGMEAALPRLRVFLERLGAVIAILSPEEHDRVAAYVSHLPQLIAVALVNLVGREKGYLRFAAGGFRDLTRIASSPYGIWEDILRTNRSRIKKALADFLQELSTLGEGMEAGLRGEFERARALRSSLPRVAKGFLRDFPRIRVALPDRPSALATATGALAEQGINIKDLELLRVREEIGGTFQIYLGTEEEAQKAAALLQHLGYEARVVE